MAKKQTDGRYRAGIVIGHDASGKPITKWASGKTKKELEASKAEIRRQYMTGNSDTRRDILFEDYAREWYEIQRRPHISESSRRGYASAFNVHILPALAGRQLRAITANDLQALLNGMAGMSKTALGNVTSILRGVFGQAYATGLIDRDPTGALKKSPGKKESRRALTDAEEAAALKVGHEHPEGLLLLILYYTGVRRGEALGLQWRDIDFKRGYVCVRRDIDFVTAAPGELKTKFSEREIPLPPELEAVLKPLRGVGPAWILPAPKGGYITQATFDRRWNRLMIAMYEADSSIEAELEPAYERRTKKQQAALKGDQRKRGPAPKAPAMRSILTPHYFRHNYASRLYSAGVDVLAAQRFLGHADVKTTLEIYTHLAKEREKNNAELARMAFAKCENQNETQKTIFAKSLPAAPSPDAHAEK